MKKIQTILIVFAFLGLSMNLQAQFSGGSGTENDPYVITTAAQLAQLATYVNAGNTNYNDKYYKLGNDISLSAYQSGAGWTPIGTEMGTGSAGSFYGVFDGNNKKITGLYINAPNLNAVGLFGSTVNAVIKNLAVENVNIRGGNNVGGIVGYIVSGHPNTQGFRESMIRCYTTGQVSGTVYVGGVVGWLEGYPNPTGVYDCYSTCKVSGDGFVGGIAGRAKYYSFLERCYSTGEVSGSQYVGGVAGYLNDYLNNLGGAFAVNCAALNPRIHCSSGEKFGRISGYMFSWIGSDKNVGFDNMLNPNGNTTWNNKGADKLDGADISIQSIKSDGTLGGRFTSADGWTTENGKLPGLFGKAVEMPVHLGGVGVDELRMENGKLRIYPNPTTGELKIENGELRMENVEIFDISGKNIFNFQLSTFNSIDVSHLPTGIYFLRMGNRTAKFIKE